MSTERPGVYAITHLPTGRHYVGSSSNLSKRWSRHRQELSDSTHRNRHLQATWNRDGPDVFAWRILVICEPEQRIAIEQELIDRWALTDPDRGFNRAAVAGVSYGGTGWERTPQWRDEQAAAWRVRRPAARPGSLCLTCGAVKDGTYTRKRTGRTGRVTVQVRCQECARKDSRERSRRARGVPLDHPLGRHFHRRGR